MFLHSFTRIEYREWKHDRLHSRLLESVMEMRSPLLLLQPDLDVLVENAIDLTSE
ncbi:MAG: hypothetical protein AAGD25_02615 [Cyanobacteria bacterium P01_F01_bin.150]